MHLVSIIIPTYNRGELLRKVMPSYLKQSLVKEIIIVDDGSNVKSSHSIQCFKALPNVKIIKHSKRLGLPAARNTGVDEASSPLIYFGEDDVLLDNKHLEVLFQHMKSLNADIIAGRLIPLVSFDEKNKVHAINYYNKIGNVIDLKYLIGNFFYKTNEDIFVPFVHACALIRREVFKKVRYDPKFFNNTCFREETDFYLRARSEGFRIVFCPHTIAYHLKRPTNADDSIGGCGPKNKIISRFQNYQNNLKFTMKNYTLLRNLGINPFTYLIRYSLKFFSF